MKDIMKKIFENIIKYEKNGIEMEKYLDQQMQNIIDRYTNQISEEQIEKLREHLSYMTLIAEQEGFQLGIKYAIKIMISLLKDS